MPQKNTTHGTTKKITHAPKCHNKNVLKLKSATHTTTPEHKMSKKLTSALRPHLGLDNIYHLGLGLEVETAKIPVSDNQHLF